MPLSTYDYNPAPQPGSGIFGAVPGAITPPDPYASLSAAYPNLSGTNAAASNAILSKLGGNISPGTMNALKLASAQFGVGSGMPLSGLSTNQLFGNIAGFSEGQQQQGLQDYASVVPTVSRTQTLDPALQADIASRNATMRSAPNPAQAQSYAQSLFDRYLTNMRGPAAGTGGGGRSTTRDPQADFFTRGWASDRLGAGNSFGGPLGYSPDVTSTSAALANYGSPETESDVWASMGVDPSWLGLGSTQFLDSQGNPVPAATAGTGNSPSYTPQFDPTEQFGPYTDTSVYPAQ